jgi:hypothetical protein
LLCHIWRWKLFSVTMCPQGRLARKKNVTSKQMDMTNVSERMVMWCMIQIGYMMLIMTTLHGTLHLWQWKQRHPK